MARSKKKKRIKSRDLLMVLVINGVTKAGVHKDRKKAADKKKCRKPVDKNEESK